MKPATLLAIALGAAACGEDAPPEGTAALIVGTTTAEGAFAPAPDGSDVTLAPGAQGGFHVWVSFQVQGAAGELSALREARRDSDGELILRATAQDVAIPSDAMDAWWESPDAAPAFMCPSPIGLSVIDVPVRIVLRLQDGDEVLAEDEMVVVPRCPADELAFCESICSG